MKQMHIRPFTLIETIIVASILAIALVYAGQFMATQHSFSRIGQEKKFGYQKAIQILNEIKTFEESNAEGTLSYLDDLSDGTSTSAFLTIQEDILDPLDPVSDNAIQHADLTDDRQYKYSRRVHIQKYYNTNAKDVRKVGVELYLTSEDATDDILLAEVWSVVQTAADPAFPPTQVYDLYAIAIENVPGWWVYMNNLIPQVENAIRDIEGRNPGLDIRVHWITKMGYGRDPFYSPVINVTSESTATQYQSPYFYPATMPSGSATTEYYVPTLMNGVYVDENGARVNDSSTRPYTYADTYNQSKRYEDLREYYATRKTLDSNEEMPYSLLLDDFYSNPTKYRNALFINLHGELLPVPSIRNYSDPAKHPNQGEHVNLDGLETLIVDTKHAVTMQAIEAGTTTVSLSRLQDIANDDDIAVNDMLRLGNEIVEVTNVNSTTKTITMDRGQLGTTAQAHGPLTAISFVTYLTAPATPGTLILPINSNKGLTTAVTGHTLHAYSGNTSTAIGTINASDSTTITVGSRLDGQAWPTNSIVGLHTSHPVLADDINTSVDDFTLIGAGTNFGTNELIKINDELILTGAANATLDTQRAQHGSTAVAHSGMSLAHHVHTADNVRVVTHPENIRYDDNDNLRFRVYSYLSEQAAAKSPERLSTVPISVIFRVQHVTLDNADPIVGDWIGIRNQMVQWIEDNNGVSRIEGGVEPAGQRYESNTNEIETLSYPNAPTNDALTETNDSRMYAKADPIFIRTSADGAGTTTGYLAIAVRLYNSPLTAPQLNNKGLPVANRLYDLEYLPNPQQSDWDRDLTFDGTVSKNTARWFIDLPSLDTVKGFSDGNVATITLEDFYHPLGAETRLGDMALSNSTYDGIPVNEVVTGTTYGQFQQLGQIADIHHWAQRTANYSRTFTWSHDIDLYDGDNNVIGQTSLEEDAKMPFSEKYQFTGDPHHMPYLDVKLNHGYNWFFTDSGFSSGDGYDHHHDGWGNDSNEVDVPRLTQFLRQAILKSNSVWTTINGYSYYYIGTGNEIGYDSANGFASSIPLHGKPYGLASTGYAQHITNGGGSPRLGGVGVNWIAGGAGMTWYSRYWLGELYRDEDASTWQTTGLISSDNYNRVDKDNHAAIPSTANFYSGRRTERRGCKTFFNLSNDGTTTFDHDFDTNTATLLPTTNNATQDVKSDMETAFNLVMPTTVQSDRPWRLNSGQAKAEEWTHAPYTTYRTQGNVLQVLYEHTNYTSDADGDPQSGIASGILQVYDPDNTEDLGYFAVHGIAKTQDIGSVFIGRYAIMSLIYGYLRAGGDDVPTNMARIEQLPRVTVDSPTDMTPLQNPGEVSVRWSIEWQRWDELAYTGIATYDETINAAPGDDGFFRIAYSDDNRDTWKYLNSNATFSPGVPEGQGLEVSADPGAPTPASTYEGQFVKSEPEDEALKTKWNYSMSWDLTGFAKGTYYLRVEYHRKDPDTGIYRDTHYSYHVMAINVEDE